jgi:anti-sigma regulatory factor (Ser/Thr protein kinase)
MRFFSGVAEHAAQAVGQESAAALLAAVHEFATNSVHNGGGPGELRVWADGRSLVYEVSDHGHITAPPQAGCRPPLMPGRRGPVG